MAKRANVAFIILFGSALVITIFVAAIYVAFLFFVERDVSFGDAVAVVDVKGEIFYDIGKTAEIEAYRDNASVKALLVHINSPGGGVAASQAIYRAILKVRETKPVVAVMGSVAASGAYYVACAADTIVAHEGTLTGSIGVIAEFLTTEELFEKVGLDVTVVKSGRYKDIGSPHRQMTEAEKAYLGRLLDGVYDQFLQAVSEGRGIPVAEVRRLAEGRLYTGEEAREAGLVDELGTYEDALDLAARMGGISGKPRVVKRRVKKPLLDRITGTSVSTIGAGRGERISLKYIIP
ncbi:MAG: signal peptide peptidase SppA [Candidatus Latescibacterota bacterium]|nr:MAG: signal peptide peptidase SppA [Candidatus Latescibacterota bacterium]